MKNNKGISAVVATVLIILITVAAVTIIWAAIIPMINNQLSRGTVCLDAMTQITIENKGYTCWNSVTQEVELQVGHGAQNVNLVALQVLISEDGATTSEKVTLGLPGVNEEAVLIVPYTTTGAAEAVSVAPIVRIGNADETCDALAAVQLDACRT